MASLSPLARPAIKWPHRSNRSHSTVLLAVALAVGICCVCSCRSSTSTPAEQNASEQPAHSVTPPAPPSIIEPLHPAPSEPLDSPHRDAEVEELNVPNDLSVFVVRGKPHGDRIVFLHGLCGNPYAYAHAFRNAAARVGTLVALQGNVSCGPGFRDWSTPPANVDARIESAVRAIGDTSALQDIIIIGYSSGGTFAELLVMRNPQRYARAILIATPQAPAIYRLRKARGVVMMAGERDRHDLMKTGMRSLVSQSIPTTFLILPAATHGEMGNDSERVMGEALDWLVALPTTPHSETE